MAQFNGYGSSASASGGDQRLTATLVYVLGEADIAGPARLLKLWINETLVFSDIAPKRSLGSPMRFYDGSQTALDPTIVAALGENATYWPGMVYLVLPDFDITPYGSVPGDLKVEALLTTSSTEQEAEEIESVLTGAELVGFYNAAAAVDYTLGEAYQIAMADDETAVLVATDIATATEIRRVALPTSSYISFDSLTALQGSGFVVGQAAVTGDLYGLVMIDTRTGQTVSLAHQQVGSTILEPYVVSSKMLRSDTATVYAVLCTPFITGGPAPACNDGMIAAADVTNKTLAWIAGPEVAPIRGSGAYAEMWTWCWGPASNGVVTAFFSENGLPTVWRCQVSSTGVSGVVAATVAATSHPVAVIYDSINGAVAYIRADAYLVSFDLDSQTQRYAVDLGEPFGFNGENAITQDNLRPGYARANGTSGQIYLIDLSDGAISLLYDAVGFDYLNYNQYKATVVQPNEFVPGGVLIVKLGDVTPGTVDAVDIITALMAYNGDYEASDLEFHGFPGNEALGFPIYDDITVDEAIADICQTLGVRKVHDAGKIHFIVPARDGDFDIDGVLTHDDIVDRDGRSISQTIRDRDAAMESGSLTFLDFDRDGLDNETEFSRPNGVFSVIPSNRRESFSTSLVMTVTQAAKQINRMVYESDTGTREYQFGVMPRAYEVGPASIVQFGYGPNDEITVVGEVMQTELRDDFSQDIVVVEALQAIETSFVGTGGVTVPVQDVSTNIEFVLLDTALLSMADDLGGAGLRGYGILLGVGAQNIAASNAWKSDDGTTYQSFGQRSGIAPVAGTITAIDRNRDDGNATDFAGSLTVLVTAGDIESLRSATEAERHQNFNFAAVGQPGRWVLVAFGDVEVDGNTAVLRQPIWGRRGTSAYLSQLVATDRFILLRGGEPIRYSNAASKLGDTVYYKGGYQGLPVGQMITQIDIANGEAEKPYAPERLSYSDAGAIRTVEWQFPERLGIMPPLLGQKPFGYSEGGAAFQVDIMDGSDVLDTLDVTDPEADFDTGDYPTATGVTVYQMALAGQLRGHPASLTF